MRLNVISGIAVAMAIVAQATLGTVEVLAANPQLSTIRPSGAQRGKEVEVVFSGARLGDSPDLLLYYPGIEVKQIAADGDNRVKATLAIAPDCRPGIHALRIRTATGVSNLQTFMVGVLPDVEEKEPNNDFANPQKIDLNVTVNGICQNEDVDYYLVEAKKGQRITAEIEGMRVGQTFFDPFVAILDKRRFELAVSDDDALTYQDGVVSIIAPEDGEYVILVRETSYGGNGNCVYRLHVGDFPRPKAAYPSGGKPGETLEVQYLGDVAGPFTGKVTVPTDPPAMFGLFPETDKGIPPSPVPFRISPLDNHMEQEPNNELAKATVAAAPGALNGVISEPGDVDYFRIPCKRGQTFEVNVYARRLRSPLDSVVRVLRANGGQIAANDDSQGNPDSSVRFTAPADEDCIIEIKDHLGRGGQEYVYRIEVTEPVQHIATSLPEVELYKDTVVAVPAGNRMAVMASAARQNVRGALQLNTPVLPPGVKLETPVMPEDQSQVPLLFEAAADAQQAGALSPLVASLVGVENPPSYTSQFRQQTWQVRGNNNNLVWGHVSDRMTIVTTQPAPYSIEIVQPKAPLVRRGTLDLKVKVNRKEDFKQPVVLRMLYNPPGVGSSTRIEVPADKDEGIITLNATPNAALATWKIAVVASATVGNGPIEVSSQLADLQVAESYFVFDFERAAVEQGKQTSLAVTVNQLTDFEGTAKVELLGLPNEAKADPVEITKDTERVVFNITTTDKTPPGRHRALICKAVVEVNGEQVVHNLGTGELRVDAPLPKPAATAKAEPKPEAKPEEKKEKPLSRLEQLRQAAEAAKAAGAGGN